MLEDLVLLLEEVLELVELILLHLLIHLQVEVVAENKQITV